MTALIDTSFLVGLINANDRHHHQILQTVQTVNEPIIIPVSVLPEVCYLVGSRLGHTTMRRFMQQLITSSMVFDPLTREDLQRTVEILNEYGNSKLDFVDASIVAIAERRNIIRILTLDRRDFSIIRPRHTPYFEILP